MTNEEILLTRGGLEKLEKELFFLNRSSVKKLPPELKKQLPMVILLTTRSTKMLKTSKLSLKAELLPWRKFYAGPDSGKRRERQQLCDSRLNG